MLVDALATDLELDGADQQVTHPVEPTELGTRAVTGEQRDLGQRGLQVHTVDKVTVALDRARHLLAPVRGAVEGVLDGLHGEVGVTTVHDLEDLCKPSLSGYLNTSSHPKSCLLLVNYLRDWTIT